MTLNFVGYLFDLLAWLQAESTHGVPLYLSNIFGWAEVVMSIAAAFATQQNWPTFLIGLASAIGAGISMGFAEALSDDGSLTGRGGPWLRGAVCGLMTALGGLGHAQ